MRLQEDEQRRAQEERSGVELTGRPLNRTSTHGHRRQHKDREARAVRLEQVVSSYDATESPCEDAKMAKQIVVRSLSGQSTLWILSNPSGCR